jgi:ATP-dependent Zn protease
VIGPTRALTRASLALLLACGVAFGLFGGVALAASAKSESEAEFRHQLEAKQVQSVVINKFTRSMRVTLKDGTQAIARYPKKQSEQTADRLRAKHVSVTILTPDEAKKEAPKKKSHHKIRYIVGGVVIVVIVLVGGFLLYRRRGLRD